MTITPPETPDFKTWQLRMEHARANRLKDFSQFVEMLDQRDMFDAAAFRNFRARSKSQADWADMVGVSQGTIGNWERGLTYPNRSFRKALLKAARKALVDEKAKADRYARHLDVKFNFNPEDAQTTMNSSILRAALTDFDYDSDSGRIISIPFASDTKDIESSSIKEDRAFLLESLSHQVDIICNGLKVGTNGEVDRLASYLQNYKNNSRAEKVNPRILYRLGETIFARVSNDDVRMAISDWDGEALDGFVEDHNELMRLYYREALAKAHEVKSADIESGADEVNSSTFYDAANLLESAKTQDGSSIYHPEILALLRDIGSEVADITETMEFTQDARRQEALRRRRREAIKNGSIFVGRVLFFSSVFVVMTAPPALATVGSIATVLGLVESVVPGSILSVYERFRSVMPILPRL